MLKINILDQEGKIAGQQPAPAKIFGVKASPALIAQAVDRFLADQRKARAKVKTRSQVNGSGAKIWRQKGTGRARHGDRQAPIFVGGGVVHGPTGSQNYKKKMNKKMIRKAIFAILSEKLAEGKLFLLEEPKFEKTKEAFAFLQKVRENLQTKQKLALVLEKNPSLRECLRNIRDNFELLNVENLNVFSLLKPDFLLLTLPALKELEKFAGGTKDEAGS
ncbi:MAG: 50S ribosomal protein L4 [Microgenomates group bacterium]